MLHHPFRDEGLSDILAENFDGLEDDSWEAAYEYCL